MTLQDLAAGYKSLVGRAIYPGIPYKSSPTARFKSSKAFKTGKLLRSFVTDPSNNPNRIGRKVINGYELVLNIAPKDAPYGSYVHFGTNKMEARPFAEIALEEPVLATQFQKLLDEFISDKIDEQLEGEIKSIDEKFAKAGFSVS